MILEQDIGIGSVGDECVAVEKGQLHHNPWKLTTMRTELQQELVPTRVKYPGGWEILQGGNQYEENEEVFSGYVGGHYGHEHGNKCICGKWFVYD